MIIVIIYFYFNGHFFFLSSYGIIGDQIPVRTCYQARVSRYHLRCSGDWCPPLILAGYGMKFISFLMILSNVREEHISGLDIPEEMTLMWYEFKRLAVTLFNTNSNVMTGLKLHLSLVYGVPPTPKECVSYVGAKLGKDRWAGSATSTFLTVYLLQNLIQSWLEDSQTP